MEALTFSDPKAGAVYQAGRIFSREGAAALVGNYDGKVKPAVYVARFRQFYQAALRGIPYESIRQVSDSRRGLSLAAQKAAYAAGEVQRGSETIREDTRKPGETPQANDSTSFMETQFDMTRLSDVNTATSAALARDAEIAYNKATTDFRFAIQHGLQNLRVIPQLQVSHLTDSAVPGKSFIMGELEDAQLLVTKYAGTGVFEHDRKGNLLKKEIVYTDMPVGMVYTKSGDLYVTSVFKIHYRKTGTHIVPRWEEKP